MLQGRERRYRSERAPMLRIELVAPPGSERGGVVRTAGGDGQRRVAPRGAKSSRLALPTQHAEARDAEARERLVHEARHGAKVLAEDRRLARSRRQHVEEALAE